MTSEERNPLEVEKDLGWQGYKNEDKENHHRKGTEFREEKRRVLEWTRRLDQAIVDVKRTSGQARL